MLIRRWGRLGTRRARAIIKLVLEDAEAVWREVQEISRLRGRHGYALVKEVWEEVIEAEEAGAHAGTGFTLSHQRVPSVPHCC